MKKNWGENAQIFSRGVPCDVWDMLSLDQVVFARGPRLMKQPGPGALPEGVVEKQRLVSHQLAPEAPAQKSQTSAPLTFFFGQNDTFWQA